MSISNEKSTNNKTKTSKQTNKIGAVKEGTGSTGDSLIFDTCKNITENRAYHC